jgi:hypothetical protein
VPYSGPGLCRTVGTAPFLRFFFPLINWEQKWSEHIVEFFDGVQSSLSANFIHSVRSLVFGNVKICNISQQEVFLQPATQQNLKVQQNVTELQCFLLVQNTNLFLSQSSLTNCYFFKLNMYTCPVHCTVVYVDLCRGNLKSWKIPLFWFWKWNPVKNVHCVIYWYILEKMLRGNAYFPPMVFHVQLANAWLIFGRVTLKCQ